MRRRLSCRAYSFNVKNSSFLNPYICLFSTFILLFIPSAGGLRGEPAAPAYSATKAYQINYMEAIRKKAFRNGGCITVTDVRPGLVDTAMAKGEGLFWVMSVEKVATQIISAISRKKSKVYVTKRWHILALLYRILPFYIFKRL